MPYGLLHFKDSNSSIPSLWTKKRITDLKWCERTLKNWKWIAFHRNVFRLEDWFFFDHQTQRNRGFSLEKLTKKIIGIAGNKSKVSRREILGAALSNDQMHETQVQEFRKYKFAKEIRPFPEFEPHKKTQWKLTNWLVNAVATRSSSSRWKPSSYRFQK